MNGRQEHRRISCEIDGQTFEGNYWIAGKILVVSTAKGGASHQLGSGTPEAQAERMLCKLAGEGKA
ncbi:MAG: hypothetical protein ABTQ26_19595 [Azonexus sp.]